MATAWENSCKHEEADLGGPAKEVSVQIHTIAKRVCEEQDRKGPKGKHASGQFSVDIGKVQRNHGPC